jgi:membrane-associated phospholipid phosphatase
VAAGSVTILALVYGPLVLGGYLLVGLLGWSRVTVGDHTVPQVVSGSVLGAAAAFLAYAVIIRLAGAAGRPTGLRKRFSCFGTARTTLLRHGRLAHVVRAA